MSKDSEEIILLYIGDQAFSLSDLGPAADMRMDQGLQNIIDQGLLGEQYKGKAWHEVINPSGMTLDSRPAEDDTFLFTLHNRWRAAEQLCKDRSPDGKLTDADRDLLSKHKREYELAKKLSKE